MAHLPSSGNASISMIQKSKTATLHGTIHKRKHNRRRHDTLLLLVIASSTSFLLGSNLTLLLNSDTSSFHWTSVSSSRSNQLGSQSKILNMQQNDSGQLFSRRPEGKFPKNRKHIVAHGEPRSGSTLLFNMVGVSTFLFLMRHEPQRIPYMNMEPKYLQRKQTDGRFFSQDPTTVMKIYKTHADLEKFLRYNVTIFTTAKTDKEAGIIKSRLTHQGHDVAYVQSMQSLQSGGIPRIAHDFAFGYDLPKEDEELLVEYFSKWDILRCCCGEQMSKYWRNDLTPEIYKRDLGKHHPFCADHDIDEVEKAFMETKLYSWLDAYPNNMRLFNKPSLRDEELNGSYCSSYNERIRSDALGFYGQSRVKENVVLGDWTEQEHAIFLEGLQIHGSDNPHKIAKMLSTRTEMQVRLHLNDYVLENAIRSKGIESHIPNSDITIAYDEKGKLHLIDKTAMSDTHSSLFYKL